MRKYWLAYCCAVVVAISGCGGESTISVEIPSDEEPSHEPSAPSDENPVNPPVNDPVSVEIRCDDNGQNVIRCEEDECSVAQECENGCSNSECVEPLCGEAGTHRCDKSGVNVEVCGANGQWEQETSCPDGCDEASSSCRTVCREDAVRCSEDGSATQICRDGEWLDGEACANGCEGNACVIACSGAGDYSCQGDDLAICRQNWEIVESCENGCDPELKRCKPDCRTVGDSECTANGALKICQADYTWLESPCEFGCYVNGEGVSSCKRECANAGEVRCKDSGIETCSSDYQWTVTTKNCASGCSNGSCNQCKTGEVSCNAAGNVQTCQNSSWKETKKCTDGCYQGECKGCGKVGKLSCSANGHVQTCQSDGSQKETQTCSNGCFSNETTAYCKSCTDIGGSGCSTNGKDILTCTDYHLVKTKSCDIACRHYAGSSPYCAECAAKGTSCSSDGTSIVTCSDTLKASTTKCEKGCYNGKCKACSVVGEVSCNSAGNVQTCSSLYQYSQTSVCEYGCSNGACKECSTTSDCTAQGGWKSGTCAGASCRASTCAAGYVLNSNTCTLQIPFAGNVFVTAMDGDIISNAYKIIRQTEGTIDAWKSKTTKLSLFFKPKTTGSMKLFVEASLPSGVKSSTVSFTYGGVTHDVVLNSTSKKVYSVGTWNVTKAGYVQIDMAGKDVSPSGAVFANMNSFYIGGNVAKSKPVSTTMEAVGDAYWHRRGPSVHLNYTMPSGNVEWFYNEVTVPANSDVVGTYFMLTGFSEGYMGIQVNSATQRKVLFSVWSGYSTDDPGQIPKDYQVTTLRKGTGVTAQTFGNEGSGMQSFMDYAWKAGKTYKTLVHIKPTGTGSTDYTGYFCDENGKWYLLASFRRPKISTWYKGAHSFLENFKPESSIYSRQVSFTNQWMRTDKGVWSEVTSAQFTCDNTGKNGYRSDMEGYVSGKNFVLKNCGHTATTTEYGKRLTRTSSGTSAPTIDFAALEKLK